MSDKKVIRLRRARQARLKMRELEAVRLCVYRSSQHMYAQVISADGGKVLASASTLDAELRGVRKPPVSPRWHLTVLASSTTAVSRHWPTLLVKAGWSSKLWRITSRSATKATSRS